MRLEDLGIIGNCQWSALVDRAGDVVWCCLPRFDSEPVFASLLDAREGGRFGIGPADGAPGVQRYVPNTVVLETTFTASDGSFRVLDLAPRFVQFERFFRPLQMARIVEPLSGNPCVRIVCEPRLGWSRREPGRLQGSNHIDFEGFQAPLRLTTDLPLSYLGGQPFALTERRHLVLSWGAPLEEPLAPLCDRFLNETVRYWQRWVKHCNVPPLFQEEVIRSALTLKLHVFEDTGAIIAATTTSLPESAGSGRTWDYRYCWLRDAAYVLAAFRRLGHFEERERFVQFLLSIAAARPDLDLAPIYRVDGTSDLEERILHDWPGFAGDGPVRVGNAAVSHLQHDIFGEMILALAPVMLDDRFRAEQTPEMLELLERLTRRAIALAGTPDAGIWEYRRAWQPQTFSSLMCWAGADRMARVADRHRPALAPEFRAAADRIAAEIQARAWSQERQGFVSTYDGADLDASLLQMVPLRFLPAGDPRLRSTVDAITAGLGQGGWLLRYRNDDGLGIPSVPFILCTFWLVEALALTGRTEEAREVFERARAALSPLGLLAEHYQASDLKMWGNFPQAYSHVGVIHAAFEASPRWSEIL